MIPVRLSVKNFLSYRDGAPTLDLEGVHVACLCGDNGHGKSALLDAITWALWGRSRAGVQEDLIYQGESEMRVELEFQAGDERYRVSRRHARASRGRQGATVLHLELLSGGEARSMDGNTVRETEERIRQLLRMTYETFVNSAFILQGRANMFTAKRPAERKEVLGDVLDLSWYERLAERARRGAREQGQESQLLEAEIARIDQVVSERDAHEMRLSDLASKLEGVGREETAHEARLESLQEQVHRLRSLRADLDRRELEAQRLENELKTRELHEHETRRQLEEAQGKVARLPALEAEAAEARALTEQLSQPSEGMEEHGRSIKALQATAQRMRETGASLHERVLELEASQRELEALEREEGRILEDVGTRERRASNERRRLDELGVRAGRLPALEVEAGEVRALVEKLSAPSMEMEGRRAQSQALQARAHHLREVNASLRRDMDGLKAKKDMLEQAAGPDGAGVECPLCGSALAEEGCVHLAASYEEEGKALARRFRENEAVIFAGERQRAGIERELESSERERLAELRKSQARLDKAAQDLADARTAGEEAGRLASALEADGLALDASHSRLRETQETMSPLREALTALPHARALQEESVAAIRESESEGERLDREWESMDRERRAHQARAQERRDALTRDVAEAVAAGGTLERLAESQKLEAALLAAAQSSLEELMDGLPSLRETCEALPAVEEDYDAARSSAAEIRSRRNELSAGLAEVQAWLKQCGELEESRGRKLADRAEAAYRQGAYDQLATAFGKGGIQALLIEQAIPELETHANDILGRVSDHRMSLKLETQRERRGGGDPRETLDIRISDELGTRSYETYSGGEAFRIDFALRIALSRLLAHRSGAPLPTLFIDEGFGSQDAAGLERLVEAIQAIQSDFQRILVITHIEELKDRFPVRIEVTKTDRGSTFALS